MAFKRDRAGFPSSFYINGNKTDQRTAVADHALLWLRIMKNMKRTGCIMVDIDDTLIDGNEAVHNGFQFMRVFYCAASQLYPLHMVTARPDSDHAAVIEMMWDRGYCIPPDRLHMLPAHLYGKTTRHVEEFKFKKSKEIAAMHNGLLVRVGDKLWDVTHLDTMDKGGLHHVADKDSYVFIDPLQPKTASYKLPG
jgi:hypothetical protein